jgi:hypothetical protein
MRWIDEEKLKYKTVKKDGKYYLLTEHYDTDKNKRVYYRIEVTGKKNVLTYIKNNGLKKYEEEEWFYEY